MLLLLGILKRNNKYYMNIVNTDKPCEIDNYQFINPYLLNNCANVSVQHYLSNKQDPKEYLRGDFDVTNLVVDDKKLKERINDYQIIAIYYDDKKIPCLYKAIDRAGNISMHDISEFEYTKNNSILGDDINNLPDFVEKKNLDEAYLYMQEKKQDQSKFGEMPVGLARHYLMGVKGFKEGYHIVTKVNHGVPLSIHEYMLFKGTATIKLIEYIPKKKDVFLTKQDYFSNPYPKERTVEFLPSPIILLAATRVMPKFCKFGVNTVFTLYNSKSVEFVIPFDSDSLEMYDKYISSQGVHTLWHLDFSKNISLDIYKNILPNEIFKLPSRFCRDMKNLPFSYNRSYKLEEENDNVKKWIYTVALLICWQYYSDDYKRRLRTIIKDYKEMYATALDNLVKDIGPKNTLVVMKWTQDHLKEEMKNILNSDISVVDEYSCLFTFYQNEFDLPEALRVYSVDTIINYGGVDKLKKDFDTSSNERKIFIIKSLEKIENELSSTNNLGVETDIEASLKRVSKSIKKKNYK